MTTTAPPRIEDLLHHAAFVRGLARAATRGDHDVDDVVQATWLATLERGPRHGGAPKGWLAAVTRNAARALGRSEGRRRARERVASRPEALPSTAEIVAKEEVRRTLLEAVLGLDEPYRSAVLLRYYEELPPREVALRLGVPVETARTRVKRGLKLLRASLDERWGGDRRAWASALVPLAGPVLTGSTTAAGAGALGKAAAALLVLGLAAGGVWLAAHRTDDGAAKPPVPAAAAAPDDDPGPRLRPAPRVRARYAGTIRGRVTVDDAAGPVTVSAARVGGADRLDLRRMMANPLANWVSPPLGGEAVARGATEPDGSFRLEGLDRGLYLVTARTLTGRVRVGMAAVAIHGGEGDVAIDLRGGPHQLRGRVSNADGSPARGFAYLQVLPDGPMASVGIAWPSGTEPRPLDAEGRFAFDDLAERPLAFVYVEPGVRLLRRESVTTQAEQPLELVVGSQTTLSVKLVDAVTGDPVGRAEFGAYVRLGSDASFFAALVRGEADGRVDVPDLGRRTHAFVRAPGYAGRQARLPKGGADLTIELDRLATVAGRVADANGEARPGVTVHAYPADERGEAGRLGQTDVTDASGRYEIDDVSPGDVVVFAHGGGWSSPRIADMRQGGFNPYVLTASAGETTEADLEVVAASAVEGRLVDAHGQGVPSAQVRVRGEPWPTLRPASFHLLRASTTTDAEGRFRLDAVLPGSSLHVVATAPGDVRGESEPFGLAPGQTRELAMRAGAADYLDVRVVDEAGDVVDGARISLVRVDASGRRTHMRLAPRGPADAEGRLHLGPLDKAMRAVAVEAEGYLAVSDLPLPPASSSGSRELDITLRRGLVIAGRVALPSGMDGTTVTVDLRSTGDGERVRKSIEASADGAFRFETLPPGSYEVGVSASLDGHRWTGQANVNGADDSLEVRLERGRRVLRPASTKPPMTTWRVEVRAHDGAAIAQVSHRYYVRRPGMAWQYSGFGRGKPAFHQSALRQRNEEICVAVFDAADARGRALPLGAALLWPADLPSGGGTVEVTMPPEQRIHGRIVDRQGKGVAGVPILAFPHYEVHGLPSSSHDPHAKTRSARDGTFAVGGLGAFEYELRIDPPDAYAPPVPVPAAAGDANAEIILRPSATATIRVRDERGRPVPNATVNLTRERGGGESDVTGADGQVVFRGLDPDLSFRLSIYVSGNPSPFLRQDLEGRRPGDIEAVLPSAHHVSGVVVDEMGDAIPYARVHRQLQENSFETKFADAEGRFRIDGLPAGRVVLMVAPPLVLRWFEGIKHDVRAGTEGVSLEARRGAGIAFLLPDSVDPRTVSMWFTDESDANIRVSVHASMLPTRDGTLYRLDPERTYVLYAVAPGGVFYRQGLRPGADVLSIAFQPGRELMVTVDLPGGLPADKTWQDVNVTAEGPGYRRFGRLVDAAKPTWVIGALPSGRPTVKATLQQWRSMPPGSPNPFERAGPHYEAVREDVTESEVHLTLQERP